MSTTPPESRPRSSETIPPVTPISYGPGARVRLCLMCGHVFDVPLGGGDVTCAECGTVTATPPRTLAPLGERGGAEETPEEERARLGRLQRQVQQYNRANRYATVQAPEGMEELSRLPEQDEATLGQVLATYREVLPACLDLPSQPLEHQLYWLTWKLNNIYVQQDRSLKAWAVIQTSMDALADPGYQHLLRTMAADKARKAKRYDAAEAWLALCDPASPILDLDSDYRCSRACLDGALGHWDRVLRRVGLGAFDVPFDPAARLMVGLLRVTALEKLGRGFEAEEAMRELAVAAKGHETTLANMTRPGTIFTPAREVEARIQQQDRAAEGLDVEAPGSEMLPPGEKLLVAAGLVLFFGVGAIALGVFLFGQGRHYGSYRPVEAEVLSASTRPVTRGGKTKAGVAVTFRYRVAGVTYTSQQASPGDPFLVYARSRQAEEKAAALLRQRRITAYYPPDAPAKGVLEVEVVVYYLFGVISFVGAAALAFVAFLLVRRHRRRRRAHEAWMASEAAKAGAPAERVGP